MCGKTREWFVKLDVDIRPQMSPRRGGGLPQRFSNAPFSLGVTTIWLWREAGVDGATAVFPRGSTDLLTVVTENHLSI